MHITILALGSHGDVYPFTLLGGALRRAGHDVRLVTFQGFAPLAAQQDLELHPIAGDAAALMQAGGGLDLAEAGLNIPRMLRGIRASFGAQTAAYAHAFADPILRQTDLLVNQLPGGIYATDLVEKARLDSAPLPLVHASVMPLTRTRAFPMLAFPEGPAFVPGYNALTYRIAEQLVWSMFRTAVNRWRRDALGLRRAPFWGRMNLRGVPVLNAFSRHVVPPAPDWGPRVHVTGYWFPQVEPWQPPDDLLRFLDAGPAPVFVGFGSMPLRRPQETIALLLDALRHSGQRAILHSGWAGLSARDLPPTVFATAYAPYHWLFPRVAAVVHHGGSGTTAAGLRAGVPALVVPFLFDQFFWGRRLHRLGVAPAPLPFKKLAAPALSRAIDRLVHDTSLQRHAAALALQVRAEPGLARAVALLEENT